MAKREKIWLNSKGEVSTEVHKLRKKFGLDSYNAGMRTILDEDEGFQDQTFSGEYTKKGKYKMGSFDPNWNSALSIGPSKTSSALSVWMEKESDVFGNGITNTDYTAFYNQPEVKKIMKQEIGRAGKGKIVESKPGRHQTKTGKMREYGHAGDRGHGLKGSLDTMRISQGEDAFQTIMQNEDYKRGGLTESQFAELKKDLYRYGGAGTVDLLKNNDFDKVLKKINVIQDKRRKVQRESPFESDTRFGELFTKFTLNRLGRFKTRHKDLKEGPEVEILIDNIPPEYKDYIKTAKLDATFIFTFNRVRLDEILRDPELSDKDLDDLLIKFGEKESLNPSVRDILEDPQGLYMGHSLAMLKEGGLSEFMNPTKEDVDTFIKEGNHPRITEEMIVANKKLFPPEVYNQILDIIKENNKKDKNGKLPPQIEAYVVRVLQGWFGVRVAKPEDSLWDKLKKSYFNRVPKYKIRKEAWFKAASIEFEGNGKYFPVLMDLADRICEEENYDILFETDTEIKIWYKNWGNSDERVMELIDRLEANSGLEANWDLEVSDDMKSELSDDDKAHWLAELRRKYEAQGYTDAQIDILIKEEYEKYEEGYNREQEARERTKNRKK